MFRSSVRRRDPQTCNRDGEWLLSPCPLNVRCHTRLLLLAAVLNATFDCRMPACCPKSQSGTTWWQWCFVQHERKLSWCREGSSLSIKVYCLMQFRRKYCPPMNKPLLHAQKQGLVEAFWDWHTVNWNIEKWKEAACQDVNLTKLTKQKDVS